MAGPTDPAIYNSADNPPRIRMAGFLLDGEAPRKGVNATICEK
jgi:hypothetical protein